VLSCRVLHGFCVSGRWRGEGCREGSKITETAKPSPQVALARIRAHPRRPGAAELGRGRRPRRAARWAAVEAEFQESAHDILAGFAALGYSRQDAVAILGWHRKSAGRVLRAIDPAGTIRWPAPNRSRGRLERPRRSPRGAVVRYWRGPGRSRRRQVAIGDRAVLLADLVAALGAPHGPSCALVGHRLDKGWPLWRALMAPPGRPGWRHGD
jgi:hypothetical protein